MGQEAGGLVQHELFPMRQAMTRDELVAYLEGSGTRVSVVVTRNRVSMISIVAQRDGGVGVRLHQSFLAAPDEVLSALRGYIRTRSKAEWRLVAQYARSIPAAQRAPASGRPARREQRGRVHDLAAVARAVNAEFFNGRVSCCVVWGRSRPVQRRKRGGRSICFGSWDAPNRTVRIHPLLDDERVPTEFIRYIVFHEMLHALVPIVSENGRRRVHGPGFRALERGFPDWEAMQGLAKQLVRTLV